MPVSSASNPPTSGKLPLRGTRVLELGHIVAGPTAGLLLADLGADVIKIEHPRGGDQGRVSMKHAFPFFNRNKRSLTLDLKSDKGKELFFSLADAADVVLDNYATGVAERLGISYEQLATRNPRVIYLSVKGFLPGPYYERPFLDELAQMMGGLAFMTGPAGRPLRAGASVVDMGAATYGVIGVLCAMLERGISGRGQKITAGLFETSVFWVGQWMAHAATFEQPSVPMPELHQGARTGWAIYELFTSADGEQIFVGVISDSQWVRFCKVFGLDDLASDERLKTNADRAREGAWLIPRVRTVLGQIRTSELVDLLENASIPFAPVRRPDELLTDEHLLESGQLVSSPIGGDNVALLPKMPYRSDAYDFDLRNVAPGLGEQSREILGQLGISDAEIDELIEEGVTSEDAKLEQASDA